MRFRPAVPFLPLLMPAGAVMLISLPPSATAENTRPPLKAEKWSGSINVPDPVACSVDDQGRVFVSVTTRRKVGDLDIREWTDWIPQDLAHESIDEKRAFFHDVLAPGKLRAPRASLTDANHDGSVDWMDLTVPTEKILRLVDRDGDGRADALNVFAEDFRTEVTGIAAGVMAYGGSVYATIAPDLWRLKDTTGNGQADQRESIAHGFGLHIAYAGHDMHGLTEGPDGRIYWSIGDKGVNVVSREGKRWFQPHQGCVLRCEPDGSGFEIFAHGLRNVQEIAFDDFGNLFGVDNDADKPGEKERLVYITEQSDTGWRCAWQYHTGWNPWMAEGRWQLPHPAQPLFLTPPLALSHDGPSGFRRNPGTALSPEWRGWFFLNQFPSGKMNALRLEPEGAAFRLAEDITVSSGIMGIGMSWGPDGGLYFADWDGGYPLDGKGAVWRLDVPAASADPLRAEVKNRLAEGFTKLPDNALPTLLAHADQRVRLGAQRELAHRHQWPAMTGVLTDEKAPLLAKVHALQGLGQGLRHGQWNDDSLLLRMMTDPEPELRLQTAKILSESRPAPSAAVLTAFRKLLTDPSPRVRLHAGIGAGRLADPALVPALLEMAGGTGRGEAFLRHAAVTGLTGCAPADQLAALTKDARSEVRLAACLALGRQASPAISGFLHDADPGIAAEAAWAIHDDFSIPGALPALAAWLDQVPANARESTVRRALNANFRLGTPEAAARLARYALRPVEDFPRSGDAGSSSKKGSAAPWPAPREEALTLLSLWLKPPVLDRLDCRPRTYSPRDAAAARAALQPLQPALDALTDPALKTAGLQVMAALQLDVPAASSAAAALLASNAPEVRLASLKLLTTQHPQSPECRSVLTRLLAEKNPSPLRIESAARLISLDFPTGLEAARGLIQNGSLREQQAAVALLATAAKAEADALLAGLLTPAGDAHDSPPGLRLDIAEAAAIRSPVDPALAAALAVREKTAEAIASTTGNPAAAMSDCLTGGDPAAGRDLVLNHQAANCVACHRIDSAEGSTVGPPLLTIGSQHPPDYLLQALVAPSAVIAPGFGLTTVSLKNGTVLGGTLLKESSESLTLRQPDGLETTTPKTAITSQTAPVSVMPPMAGILTPRQLRDVTAFLLTLREKPKSSSPKPQPAVSKPATKPRTESDSSTEPETGTETETETRPASPSRPGA